MGGGIVLGVIGVNTIFAITWVVVTKNKLSNAPGSGTNSQTVEMTDIKNQTESTMRSTSPTSNTASHHSVEDPEKPGSRLSSGASAKRTPKMQNTSSAKIIMQRPKRNPTPTEEFFFWDPDEED